MSSSSGSLRGLNPGGATIVGPSSVCVYCDYDLDMGLAVVSGAGGGLLPSSLPQQHQRPPPPPPAHAHTHAHTHEGGVGGNKLLARPQLHQAQVRTADNSDFQECSV